MDQRNNGKSQLKAQHHLAQYEQSPRFAFAVQENDKVSRDDSNDAGNQPPQPGCNPQIQKPFHYDLACQRAGDGGTLSSSNQGYSEEDRSKPGSQKRGQ